MKIVTAGMYRSGTTWQFNAVRVICEMAFGEDMVYSCWVDHYKKEDPRPVHIIKTHKPRKVINNANFLFSTYRKPDEIKGSMERRAVYLKENPDTRFLAEANIARFDEFMVFADHFRKRANYVQKFGMIRKDPEMLIQDYCDVLDVELNPSDVVRELDNQMQVPEKGYDEKTLLHEGHITKK